MGHRNNPFRNSTDVASALTLPVMAVVPAMVTAQERQARARRRLIRVIVVIALIIVAGAAIAAWFAVK